MPSFCSRFRRISRPAPCFAVALALALTLSACSVNQAPRFHYGPDGEKIQFKRYEKNLARDYIHHFSSVAFHRVEAFPLGPVVSEEQARILESRGKPEYIRTDYRTETKEIATDWVYYEHGLLLQFVEGQLVYEGPLSDFEKHLIRRGRPSRSDTAENQSGFRAEVLRYRKPFTAHLEEYMFKGDRLIDKRIN